MTRIYIAGGILGFVIVMSGLAYMAGHGAAQRAADRDAARDYIGTRERIDNATGDLPDDDAGLDRLLRDLANPAP